jgi:hypothetical protein
MPQKTDMPCMGISSKKFCLYFGLALCLASVQYLDSFAEQASPNPTPVLQAQFISTLDKIRNYCKNDQDLYSALKNRPRSSGGSPVFWIGQWLSRVLNTVANAMSDSAMNSSEPNQECVDEYKRAIELLRWLQANGQETFINESLDKRIVPKIIEVPQKSESENKKPK